MINKNRATMRRLVLGVMLVVLGLWGHSPASLNRVQAQTERVKLVKAERPIRDQYIVVFKDEVPVKRISSMSDSIARRVRSGRIKHVYRYTIKGLAIEMTESEAEDISKDPEVDYVAEDGEVSINQGSAGTTQYGPPWGLDRIDQRNLPLNNYYTYGSTGAGVNVYVIDTGIWPTHQEFGGRAVIAADFVGDGQNGLDCDGHGTHVAGIIGGRTFGVAKEVRLHGVRVLSCNNTGSTSDVIAGVDWVTRNHANPAVANMSLGGAVYEPLDTAVRRSIASGVTYVISAGNDNVDASTQSPARVTEAITVGSTDESDNRSFFINGRSNYGSVIDLFAPGSNVISASFGNDTAVEERSGTSMAAPHVTGVVATYLQRFPGDAPSAVQQVIVGAASPGVVIDPGPGSPNRLLYSPLKQAPTTLPATLRVGRKVVRNADGRLEVFVVGSDHAIWHIWQVAPNSGWSQWASLGGGINIVSEPVAIMNADGRLEVFAVASHRALVHKWQFAPNGAWSEWESLDGPIYSNPAVGMNADGRLEVFAIAGDGSLWHKYQFAANSGWTGWASLHGSLASDPAVGVNADGRLEVFAVATGSSALMHKWQIAPNSGWSQWESLGGIVTSVPAVGMNADGRLEVFVRGRDYELYHRYQWAPNSGWSYWAGLGGYLTSNPVVGANADGRLEIFVRGSDYALHHRYQLAPNSGWSFWEGLGGYLTSNPAIGINADGRLEVFVRGGDYALYHRYQWMPNSGWSFWGGLQGYLEIF